MEWDYYINEVEIELDILLISLAKSIASDNKKINVDLADEELLSDMQKRYAGLFISHGRVPMLSQWYAAAYNKQKDLGDMRRQEGWANTRDHAKTLFFRTVTTLMIAGVILRKRRLIQNFHQRSPAIKFNAKIFTGAILFWFFCCRISSFGCYLKGFPLRFAHYGHNFPLTMYKLLKANSTFNCASFFLSPL
jgi:mRNA degradation ribonuclease J1/J2